MQGFRLRGLSVLLVATTTTCAVLTAPAPASAAKKTAPPKWATVELRPQPGGELYRVEPQAVSCAAVGYCAAGGYEETAPPPDTGYAYQDYAIVAGEAAGRWSGFTRLELPADAAAGNPTAQVTSISCPSKSRCVAVGYYSVAVADGDDQDAAFLATDISGKWQQATEVAFPASINGNADQLDSVSCPSTAYCAAAGTTDGPDGSIVPFTVTFNRGHWQPPTTAPSVLADMARDQMQTISLSCLSAGNCVAVGAAYGSVNNITIDPDIPLQWVESHGRWGRLTITEVPAHAYEAGGYLASVSCTSLMSCVAVGYYLPGPADQAMEVVRSDGKWRRGEEIRIDKTQTTLDAVSCTPSLCVAVGQYYSFLRSLALSEAGGRLFGTSVDIPLPGNAMPAEPNNAQETELTAVSCLGKGWCAAVGNYISRSSDNPTGMATTRELK